jgi:hypothetical protein
MIKRIILIIKSGGLFRRRYFAHKWEPNTAFNRLIDVIYNTVALLDICHTTKMIFFEESK